ncbi:MAG: UvrD-helicase domain-containing protein [Bacteroidota bacterium]|nr:UvrD-helicase domain-containing protein [Bacteroidota bacterium]
MSKLTIYKASAGSGKTFRLTAEYLKILFSNQWNYKRILAVTFTNKATAEMKSRIIRELYKLSKKEPSPYLEIIKNDLNIPEQTIQQKAKQSLSLLLHDYSKFSVSTIDKFFQKIIRSFTHEVGIQPGYSVELNQSEILSLVVDKLLMDIGENKALRELTSSLAENKIKQGKTWDFKKDILNLAREIFKEEFKAFDIQLTKKFGDKNFVKDYITQLQTIKARFENQLKKLAKEALALIEAKGLATEDFKYNKSSVPNYFNKIIQQNIFELKPRTLKGTEGYSEWITKASTKKETLEHVLDNGLFKLFREMVSYHQNNEKEYLTTIEILKFIHTLGILTDISTKLHRYCEEHNIFLISDASKLLQVIIDNNDAPFIYEKTGSIYRFFMMDEFQDTSKIQWENFKPLIGNSLAQGSPNLVVGDVKQSIYRWRNSDWEILSEKIEQDFTQYQPRVITLNNNWRSKKNIISFNNSVFYYSSNILQQHLNQEFEQASSSENPYQHKITEAYHDVIQHTPANNKDGGYIYHAFIDEKGENSKEEEIISQVIHKIELLQDKGYALKDIAVLVRKRDEGQKIANALIDYKNNHSSEYRYDFISNDSLFISNASVTRFILAVLEYLLNDEDTINGAFLTYEYHQYLKNERADSRQLHHLFKKNTNKNNHAYSIFPDGFSDSAEQLKQLPIYELIDKIIKIFNLNEVQTELPYLKAFMDMVLEFSKTKTSDIHSFISWWNEEGHKNTLSVSENQDAIRIITIHSAKGLEFKNVIIPFCNWKLDHNATQTNILWCKTETIPFNQLDIIPVQYSQKLLKTVFKEHYLDEKFHVFVDNLNLLYVAFTRAEENLFVFSPANEKDTIKDVGSLLNFTYQNYQNYSIEGKQLIELNQKTEKGNIFEYGTLEQTTQEESIYNEIKIESYESYDIKNKLRLKLHDHSFFTGKESGAFQRVNHGKVMHEIFEHIETESDIPKALERLLFEGKISNSEKEEITRQIHEVLKNQQIKDWFSNQWNVKTEAEIILPGGKKARPDRVIYNQEKTVVIDYKFGEQQEEKHKKQVKSYMEMLQKMGDTNVEGYLWYVDLGNIVAVE